MKRKQLWLLGVLAVVCVVVIYFLRSQVFKADWDRSPDNHVILYDRRSERGYNYIPDFRVWGDGRIVWVQRINGIRKVREGRLSEAQLKGLIEKFLDADFFNFFSEFSDQGNALDYIHINLRAGDGSRYISAEDKEVFALVTYLSEGAGASGKDVVPARGYLYVIEVSKTDTPKGLKAQYQWPEQKIGFTLKSLNGSEIVGDELAFAWMVVNSGAPLVKSNGITYWIGVIIPGISPF